MTRRGTVVQAHGETRGTQSFVGVMQAVWKRPALTAIEIAWRWVFGVPLLVYVWWHLDPVVRSDPQSWAAVAMHGGLIVGVDFNRLAMTVAGLLLVWCLLAAAGRVVLLKKLGTSGARWGSLACFTTLRAFMLLGLVSVWAGAFEHIARGVDWNSPSFASQPNLVPKFALAVGATLLLFIVWSLVSWRFSLPLVVSAVDGVGVGEALRSSAKQRPMQSKMIEINFVMGIVKVALLVLLLVFSACPLPFQAISTPEFLARWWTAILVLYLLGSDFFHVVRLASYVELYRALKSPRA